MGHSQVNAACLEMLFKSNSLQEGMEDMFKQCFLLTGKEGAVVTISFSYLSSVT